jgi:hypothetical protein
MKAAIVAGLVGFGVGMAVVIGQRMTVDALAVVLGVFVGVVASVPVAVALALVLRKRTANPERAPRALEHAPQRPLVIVVQSEEPAPLVLTQRVGSPNGR